MGGREHFPSNKHFKINCQNWDEEKSQHPNQNPTKLISSIIFSPIPLQICPHTYTEFYPSHEKYQIPFFYMEALDFYSTIAAQVLISQG